MNRRPDGRKTLAALILALASLANLPTIAQTPPGAAPKRKPFAEAGTPRRPERIRSYDVRHIRGDLRFDVPKGEVRGTATHTIAPLHPGLDALTIDCGAGLDVSRVAVNGKDAKHSHDGDALAITLDRPYNPEETFQVAITYAGSPAKGLRFVRPSAEHPGRKDCVWTVGEPEDAHHWIPCYDYPNDRFTAEMIVTIDRPLMAVSNGDLQSSKENADGTSTFHWKIDKELTTYLLSIDMAEFAVYRDKLGDLPIDYYVLKEIDEATARRTLGKTPKMIAFFNDKIGTPYAYTRYNQVCIPEFNGGMEHTSKTTMTDSILVDAIAHRENDADSLVAHELAHQWFGDLLTCSDWSNLWLNEGFASYFDPLFTEHDRGEDAFRLAMADELSSYLGSDRQYRRPIVEYRYNDPWQLFDGVTYAKGASVLHALRGVLGDDAWTRGVREYVAANKGKNVRTDDLRKAMEGAAGRNLGWFFTQWVERGGHPELTASWRYEGEDKTLRLKVEQTQTVDETTPLFRLPTVVQIGDDSGVREIPIVIDGKAHEFAIPTPVAPKMVQIDPKGWIPKTLAFAKPADEWIYQLEHAENVLGRIEAAAALAGTHKANPKSADAVAKAWPREKEPRAGARIVQALGQFGEPARAGLLAAAKAPEPIVRSAAFGALSGLKFDADLETLCRAAWSDTQESYRVRDHALRTLLRAKVKDADALAEAALKDPANNYAFARTALNTLLSRGGQAGREAAVNYSRPGLPAPIRQMAIGRLAASAKDDAEMRDRLVALLDDPAAEVQSTAANILLGAGIAVDLDKLGAAIAKIDGPIRPSLEARLKALKEPKPEADDEPSEPKAAVDLDRQAADLELKARELRHKAEALRIEAEKARLKPKAGSKE